MPELVPIPRVVARLTLLWGERSRSTGGLSSALSARITLRGVLPDGGDLSWLVNRAASPRAYSETYLSPDVVEIGDREIAVEFFTDTDGQGIRVGEARSVVRLENDGVVPTISTIGSIISVSVLANQTVFVNTPTDLVWTATNERGELLAVSPGSVRFDVDSGKAFLRIIEGQAEGVRPGTATVRAFVDAVFSELTTVRISSRAEVTVSPTSATIGPGVTLQLSAQVSDALDASLVWSVIGGDVAGTVTQDGLYTAPPMLGVYTVTATSLYDPEKSAIVIVTVALGGVSVDID